MLSKCRNGLVLRVPAIPQQIHGSRWLKKGMRCGCVPHHLVWNIQTDICWIRVDFITSKHFHSNLVHESLFNPLNHSTFDGCLSPKRNPNRCRCLLLALPTSSPSSLATTRWRLDHIGPISTLKIHVPGVQVSYHYKKFGALRFVMTG